MTAKNILTEAYPLLTQPVSQDPYLASMARQFPTHQFLNRSTQLVIQRQIAYFNAFLIAYFNKPVTEITVLDWGCGKGHISYLLKKQGYCVTSCDLQQVRGDSTFYQEAPLIQEQSIEVVPLAHPVVLPFSDASFDCVFSFGVLEHVENDLASLKELKRVLKANGVLIILYLPYAFSWIQNMAHWVGNHYHDRLYHIKHMKKLALLSGYEIVEYKLAQLFPKNSVPIVFDKYLEPLDRFLCKYTPLKYLATNLEMVLIAK